MSQPTPFLAQYLNIKKDCQESLLLFRMGDFYELFFDDAKIAAHALDIALTARGKSGGQPIPMAGVPVHNAQIYIDRLVKGGHRVALCEQIDDTADANAKGPRTRTPRGLVKRKIVRVFTPGTVTEEALLDPAAASIIMALAADRANANAGIAAADVSTGAFEILTCPLHALPDQIPARAPREIVLPQSLFEIHGPCGEFLRAVDIPMAPVADATAGEDLGERRLKEAFSLATIDGFGSFAPEELTAAGILCDYLIAAQAGAPLRLDTPRRPSIDAVMAIDPITRRGLEVTAISGTPRAETLQGAVDRTLTASGCRLLAARLSLPLTDPDAISTRLDAVAWFKEDDDVRSLVRGRLRAIPDLERACARLALDRGTARELVAIPRAVRAGERALADLRARTRPGPLPDELSDLASTLDPGEDAALSDLIVTLEKSVVSDPPLRAGDGDVIATGVDQALDDARALRDDSRRFIASLQARYVEETGIQTLKVKHNNVLGYFLETSAKQAERLTIPPLNASFQHRQSLANAVRFTTAELRELQDRLSRADDEVRMRQADILATLTRRTTEISDTLRAVADALARLDVAAALAEWAQEVDACRPEVDTSCIFEIDCGAHPVVQSAMTRRGENFVPNDCRLDADSRDAPRLMVITGPNMAGKSTYLRQNALFAILAQTGSFVPARRMRLGVVDRIFSRVGAGDELARGRSTFMVEMIETAAILNQATHRSLVILDEVGRGTATHDGLAIAWACVEHLHAVNGCRALFATHYHELTELASSLPGADNASLRAREWKKDLVFLHRVVAGPADKSYGIQVARLAGLPAAAIARAKDILARLEANSGQADALGDLPLFSTAAPEDTRVADSILAALEAVEPDALSARDALSFIYDLKARLTL